MKRHFTSMLLHTVIILFITDVAGQSSLQGKILNAPNGDGIELVHVSFLQEGTPHPTYITNADGRYSVGPVMVTENSPLTISPDRNDNHRLGVTTIDLVRLQRHLLGIQRITSPYQWIAADANKSQSISALDFVEIRKIVLGINTEFTKSRSWRFVRTDIQLPDTIIMWPNDPVLHSEEINKYILTQIDPTFSYDFIGVKIGDINGTYDPDFTSPLESRTIPGTISLQTPSQKLSTGQVIHVPVYPGEQTDVVALQFTFTHPGLEFAGIQSGQITLSDDDYALFQDQMTMSWFDIGTRTLDPGQPLFTLSFVSNVSGSLGGHLQLTSDITQAEWYDAEEKLLEPSLVFEEKSTELSAIHARVSPNPWTDVTTIQCPVLCDGEIRLTITDFLGRPVHQRTEIASSPRQGIQISANDVPLPGAYIYTVATSAGQVSGKMFRICP